jgi:hypothetical protein
MRVLRFLPFFPRRAGKRSTGILPMDPREQDLLDRLRATREIHDTTSNRKDQR